MGSEHKSKKRGRSTSPVIKKKSKRKYRNDRSKKSRQSSSESSSEEEEISLTSDEYPSSADEKRYDLFVFFMISLVFYPIISNLNF